jgi:hypothetical protein
VQLQKIDESTLQEIGRVVFNFSQLETVLFKRTAELIGGTTFVGEAVLAKENFIRVMELFGTVPRERLGLGHSKRDLFKVPPGEKEDLLQRSEAVLSEIEGVRTRRNQLLHGHLSVYVYYDAKEGKFVEEPAVAIGLRHTRKKKGYDIDSDLWTPTDLTSLAEDISSAAVALDTFFMDLSKLANDGAAVG